MNNLVVNFDQLLKMAQEKRVPLKKRGVLREYLQSKFLVKFYSLKEAKKMCFTGGTSLRFLAGLPRFSEDLDFDNLGLNDQKIEELVKKTVNSFEAENIKVELKVAVRENKRYFELRFPNILYQLKISLNPKEKLMVKVDYSRFWQGHEIKSKLFSQYGLIEQVITIDLNQLLVQKLTAYTDREQVQPRDMYDIVWLYAQGARPDRKFMKLNNQEQVIKLARKLFRERGVKEVDKKRLSPFLFKEKEVEKIMLLGPVLEKLK